MKRQIIKLLTLMGVLVVGLLSGNKVSADVEYDIENNVATARVNEDGSLTMKRQITYRFDDDAHGVFYQQNLGAGQKLVGAKVEVQDNGQKSVPTKDFLLQKRDEGYRFKVYHAVNDGDRLTVTYRYQITRAIANYRDVAELNFMIIGNNWDTKLDHVKASVIFPGPVKGLKAWAHGPLDGYIKVMPKAGKIVMTVDDLDGDSGIEVHTIFPPTVTAKNKNFYDKNRRQAVLKQEANLAKAANQKRKVNHSIGWGLIAVSLISGIAALIKGFTTKKQGVKPKKMAQLAHNYEIPDVDSVTAQVLDKAAKPDAHAFTAYMMQLAAQKKIKIEDYQEKRKTYYRITLLDPELVNQDKMMAILFEEVGDGQSFTTKKLRRYHNKKLGRQFDKWADEQYQKADDDGLLVDDLVHKRQKTQAWIMCLLALSLVCGFVSLHYVNNLDGIILSSGLFLLLGIGAGVFAYRRIGLYTKEGADETNKVRGFKKMLNDIGHFKMRDVGDLVLWEDIMPYAVSFDLAKKVIKELKIEFSEDELTASGFYVYSQFYSTGRDGFATNFSSSLTESASMSSSSVSGSSGGFSGGSSGGFGGGSGGGAF